ncbi:DNA ligase 1-like [Lecanosticta acicola]|uniref:DNA ligase 1-like n=1 Tax=Lecanosticta acicola TaxID=111012 RepID=A0AAI9E461_9PEZI|nr:DNA ligase 1-like [Lecanosticta acicola]
MATAERVRLHISPFNPELLDRYVPPSLKSQATNISFHSVATFPEKGFGYVELPAMEAQKLKQKLNGSTLKGSKVRIEEARPEKKRKAEVEEGDGEKTQKVKKTKKEKKKREEGVLPGYELEEGRHVKRGWTEDAGRAKKSKDGLDERKMKFKTEVPLNKVPSNEEKEKKSKTKSKVDESEKKAKSGKKAAVVKEFSRTTKVPAGSIKSERKAASYEEGVGWVDEDGNVVEAEPPSKKRRRGQASAEKEPEPIPEPESQSEGEPSSSESEEEEEESYDESSMSDHEDHLDRQLNEAKSNTERNASAERDQQNSIPVSSATPVPKEVHPLEALYKRPASAPEDSSKPKPAPIDTSFSFFGGGEEDADEDEVVVEDLVPQTPRTKEDLEWRNNRSAAPTPDTAAIDKRFDFTFDTEDQEDDDDDDTEMPDAEAALANAGAEVGEKEESEFRKWFYENRGDLNRGWKKRRREERKIVRQRENRRLNRRIA